MGDRAPRLLGRSLAPPDLVGRFVSNHREVLALARNPERIVVIDLSQGSARGCQAARTCHLQLGLPEPESDARWSGEQWRPGASADKGPAAADLIGVFIDLESRGSSAVTSGYTLAQTVLERLETLPEHDFFLLCPSAPPWQPEDDWFLRFLMAGIQDGPHRMHLMARHAGPVVPRDWRVTWVGDPATEDSGSTPGLLGLIPGVLNAEIQEMLGTEAAPALPLAHGVRWVPPELRRLRPPRNRYDPLAARCRNLPWLRAFAMARGSPFFVDPWFLCAEAWARFSEGGQTVALDLLAHAATCARTPDQRSRLGLELQGLRIAVQRFEDAAGIPDPSPDLEQGVAAGLWQMRGWARTFLGRAAEGRIDLERARSLLPRGSHDPRQDIYLDNIHALSLFRTGEAAAALAQEQRLERELDVLETAGRPDWPLRFVNCINQARLLRAAGQLNEAESMYGRAFDTCRGLASDSDLVYEAVCAARLAEARNSPGDAYGAWVRACLLWCAMELPEAIACRTATAILGRFVAPHESVAAELSDAFVRHLSSAADRTSAVRFDRDTAPNILSTDRAALLNLRPSAVVWRAGWCLLATTEPARVEIQGTELDRLRGLLGQLLAEPALRDAPTWVVDTRHGRGVALDASARAETAWAWSLSPPESGPIACVPQIMLAPGVDRVEIRDSGEVVVRFKRFRSPLRLRGPEASCVAALADSARPRPEPASLPDEVLNRLESARVLHLRGSKEG